MTQHQLNESIQTQQRSRRRFLQQMVAASAVAAVPHILPSGIAHAAHPPSERITVGLIGKGLMGSGHLRRLAGDRGIQVAAVCDVDRVRREDGKKYVEQTYASSRRRESYRGCAAYNDYRELITREDIDAVVIVTPDHWHALQATDAARAGKDVYCEKPISLTVGQGRKLVEAVQRHGCVFQTGTQYRSIPMIRRVVDFVRSGGLGKVRSVFTLWHPLGLFTNAGRFEPYRKAMAAEQTSKSLAPLDFALPGEAVPEGLDWDMWVGPALWRPYNPVYHVNPSPGVVPWSFCEDFGAASVTWHHSHSADVIQYALGMEESGPVEIIHPAGGRYPTLTYRYANGTLLHLVENWEMVKGIYQAVPAGARLAGNFGGVFVGERGWVTSMSTGGPIEGEPAGIFDEMEVKTREVNIGANDHHANWFDCIRTRRQPSCHAELGHRSASLGHLTIIAFKLGRSLAWDPVRETFCNDDQANRLLERSLRSPWRI